AQRPPCTAQVGWAQPEAGGATPSSGSPGRRPPGVAGRSQPTATIVCARCAGQFIRSPPSNRARDLTSKAHLMHRYVLVVRTAAGHMVANDGRAIKVATFAGGSPLGPLRLTHSPLTGDPSKLTSPRASVLRLDPRRLTSLCRHRTLERLGAAARRLIRE